MKIDESKKILAYKILETIIFLTFLVWSAALLGENILPGFISSHLSFLKLTIFSSILIIIFILLGRNIGASFEINIKKWQLFLLTIFSTIIIILSLIKFNWIEIAITTTTSLAIMFYFFKVLFDK